MGALGLGPGQRALDLGCGIGVVTEYLAATTGAEVVGVDRLAPVVARAEARGRAGGAAPGTVRFLTADLATLARAAEHPPFPVPVDGIVAVDTLYFVADLEPLVAAIARWMAPGGRAAIVASDLVPERSAARRVAAGETRLGRTLAAAAPLGLSFAVTDFTAAENALWERMVGALHDLRAAFAAEDALDLWRSRLVEAERSLAWARAGRIRRWLYRVERRRED